MRRVSKAAEIRSTFSIPYTAANVCTSWKATFYTSTLFPVISRLKTVTSLHREEKHLFLNFARQMLQWDPERRKSDSELLDDPWLSEESIRALGKAARR